MSKDQTPFQIDFRALRACRGALLIIALMVGSSSGNADETSLTQSPAASAAELALGERNEMCRELQRGVSEWHMKDSDCGFPFPSGNSEFSLLQWEPLDPAQHETLISDIFYWHNALGSREWDYSTFRHLQLSRRYRDVNLEMKAKVWDPAQEFVRGLIADGRLHLDRARVQMTVPGGPPFWLYRMTPVGLNRNMFKEDLNPPVVISEHACARTDIPGSEPTYFYYASPEENIYAYYYFREWGDADGARYFLWRNLLFRYQRDQVGYFHPKSDPELSGDFFLEPFCNLNAARGESP